MRCIATATFTLISESDPASAPAPTVSVLISGCHDSELNIPDEEVWRKCGELLWRSYGFYCRLCHSFISILASSPPCRLSCPSSTVLQLLHITARGSFEHRVCDCYGDLMAATVASGTMKSSTFLSPGPLSLSTSTDLPASSIKPAWQRRLVTFRLSPTDIESGFTEHHVCCKSY